MSTSNFADINTPADLARANEVEEVSAADNLMEQVLDQEPAVGLEVARRILVALRDFHDTGVKMYKEQGETDAACAWYADAVLLDRAANLIQDIAL